MPETGLLASQAPSNALKFIYAIVMFAVAGVLYLESRSHHQASVPAMAGASPDDDDRDAREIISSDGRRYTYRVSGVPSAMGLSGAGALLAGMVSTGVGEATMPNLVRRMRVPVPVAAATSTLVVAGTVVGAALTHVIQLTADGGISATPWNLVVWAVPGAIVGAQIGSRLQGRFAEGRTELFFALLFGAIGIIFLLMVTVLGARFDTG